MYNKPYLSPSKFELEFNYFLIDNLVTEKRILHIGPGDHHFLAQNNYGNNQIVTFGYSPTEYDFYKKLITNSPEIMKNYIMMFYDIYMLPHLDFLGTFDYITMFHCCEYSENSKWNKPKQYGQAPELELIKYLGQKLRNADSRMVFTTGSNHWDVAETFLKNTNLAHKEDYKSLKLYANS